jgi:hypothetical protein
MDTTNNKGAPSNGTPSTPQGDSNSAHAQRQRLLERLRVASLDTLQARTELDILHPAARVMELRKQYCIDTVWVTRHSGAGKPHRVALYVLHGEAHHE